MLTAAALPENIDRVTVSGDSGNPVITVFPVTTPHLYDTDTYELTGVVSTETNGDSFIQDWTEGGGGCNAGYC